MKPVAPEVSFTDVVEALRIGTLEQLVQAVAAYGPKSFIERTPQGDSLHARALAGFMYSVDVDSGHTERRQAGLQWLIDQEAPYSTTTAANTVAAQFCGTDWAGTRHSDIVSGFMSIYVALGLLDVNAELPPVPNKTPGITALASAIMVGNPVATRILLDAGASESAALKHTNTRDLAEFALQAKKFMSHRVAATITEFQMKRSMGSLVEQPLPGNVVGFDVARRRMAA